MDITVKKFGGSSLASATSIKRCAATVADTASKGCAVVVVVSAMGTSTDHLSEMLSQFCPNSRESDVVLSSGEQVSAGLFAAALFDLGIKAESLLGWQVPIFTDSTHSCAKVVGVGVDLIMQKLQSGTIPVIAGFQGVCDGKLTTLGRGGSDITAAALSCALGAKDCQIYTDVSGVMPLNPKDFSGYQKPFKSIGRDQILEMGLETDVLHNRAVDIAKKSDFAVQISSSFDLHHKQKTSIVQNIEEDFSFAVTYKKNRVLVKSKDYCKIFNLATKSGIETDLCALFEKHLVTVFSHDDFIKIEQLVDTDTSYQDIALVNLVGSSQACSAQNIGQIFDLLSDIDILFLNTTKIKIAFAIFQFDLKKVMMRLEKLLEDSACNKQIKEICTAI